MRNAVDRNFKVSLICQKPEFEFFVFFGAKGVVSDARRRIIMAIFWNSADSRDEWPLFLVWGLWLWVVAGPFGSGRKKRMLTRKSDPHVGHITSFLGCLYFYRLVVLVISLALALALIVICQSWFCVDVIKWCFACRLGCSYSVSYSVSPIENG